MSQGIKVKMDDQGNILVKRVSKCNVYVKSTAQGDETAIGNDVLKLPNCALEMEKPVKVRGVGVDKIILRRKSPGMHPATLSDAVDLPSEEDGSGSVLVKTNECRDDLPARRPLVTQTQWVWRRALLVRLVG